MSNRAFSVGTVKVCLGLFILFLGGAGQTASAGGARFISGDGWGVPHGFNVIWGTSTLLYYTDPGPLSPSVTHAQADAMVAAAAAVWSAPTSSISIAQGGELAEDVSTVNTYFDGAAVVFPADLQPANEANIPVAIVYDSDGSLTDLLLGEGASEPDGCRQNAVVGDIDDIHHNDGQIHHATLILNGRCVGSAPQQLTQMQYQLARAFGRVLGLSWSQTNDNVFTGQTTITANQMAYWPLMHPIDVICGNYSYQCMTNPFTLRVDDLNSLAQLYPVYQGAVPPGKQGTSNDALWLWGILYFPTGQGMDWANITTRRQNNGVTEQWQTTSSITGSFYSQAAGTPLDSTAAVNSGSQTNGLDGYFSFRRVPLNGMSNVFFVSEPINSLYSGDYAVGPYIRPPVAPSGSPATYVAWSALSAGDRSTDGFLGSSDAASNCNPGQDGTESAPAPLDASGWQTGLLCGWGHNSWWSVTVAAGHTWTMELTATDETGSATVNKALPVIGVWSATDAAGTPPTIASASVPFNSMVLGMTQLPMSAGQADQNFRLSVSDQFGAGRPDFTYVARFLYAGSVSPATVGSGGGQIAVTGSGFKQGNQVLINGAPAHVLSWSANQIVADAPTMAAAGAQPGVAVDVTVIDAGTGGSTTIPTGMSYTPAPDLLTLVSVPAVLETTIAASTPFAVRVLASDGLSPVANAIISFTVASGSAQLGLCGGGSQCTATTDANGLVQTTVSGEAAGTVSLVATEMSGGASVQVTIADSDPVRAVRFTQPRHWVASGATGSWTLQLAAAQDGTLAVGAPVTWTVGSGLTAVAGDSVTGPNGEAQLTITVSGVAPGAVHTVTACIWSSVCDTWTLYSVDPSQWVLTASGSAVQSLPQSQDFGALQLTAEDTSGHPLELAPVQVYQRVLAWEGLCGTAGVCAAAPVLSATSGSVTSDETGAVAIEPLQIQGIPQVLEIAASTGSQGFITLTLTKTP